MASAVVRETMQGSGFRVTHAGFTFCSFCYFAGWRLPRLRRLQPRAEEAAQLALDYDQLTWRESASHMIRQPYAGSPDVIGS
jgi:hypothetical protein